MGKSKSPAKWIKAVLFGKKSSKSNTSKGREKIVIEKEVSVDSDVSHVDMSSASHFNQSTTVRGQNKFEPESYITENSSGVGGLPLPVNEVADLHGSAMRGTPSDPEGLKQEKAAITTQAAFRGYLARRAFRALKGIIRLQALIRGHLVRRQAVATLCCMLGLVKLQAVIRGGNIRCSNIGLKVREKYSQSKSQGNKVSRVYMVMLIRKLSTNTFIVKLLAPSPTAMPLHLHYNSAEPNSVMNWLDRWSLSGFWKPVLQPKIINPDLTLLTKQKKTIDAEIGRPKRSVRKIPAGNIDNSSSVQATADFEKPKRNLRKISSRPGDSALENPQIELEKVKRNLRKVHKPLVDNAVQAENGIEKPKRITEESGKTDTTSIACEQEDNHETAQEAVMEKSEELDLLNDNDDRAVVDLNALQNGEDESPMITKGESGVKDELTVNGNPKTNKKVSTPGKQEPVDNGLQNIPTLPSYMAATQSAKAKLRLQGSPKFGQDSMDKNAIRRYSLPSANTKMNLSSPKTQRLLHANSNGGNKGDRSVLSSRDGNTKVTHADWRR